MTILAKTITIAAQSHQEQVNRAGAPCMLHLIRVMLAVRGEEEQIVAILHNLLEDTDWTLDRLAAEGFSPAILHSIDAVTHREDESYLAYIARLIANPIATCVQLADMRDNLALLRLESRSAEDLEQAAKYHRHSIELMDYLERSQS